MRVCYIAYSCSPYGGSEEAIGWNLPMAMSEFAEVTVITKEEQRGAIEDYVGRAGLPVNVRFVFCDIPNYYKRVFKGGLYSGRLNPWLKVASLKASELHKEVSFDVCHQITPIEFRALGEYELPGCKLVAGPLGGGEYAPAALAHYLDCEKLLEGVRRRVNESTLRSASWRRKLESYDSVLFANEETKRYLSASGVRLAGGEVRTEIGVPRGVCEAARQSCEKAGRYAAHEPVRLLYMGRLVPRKGVGLLLDSCRILKREGMAFHLRVCGGGKQEKFLKERVNELELGDVVEFAGVVAHDRIGDEYKWCDVMVMPSVRETGGTVIAEALSRLKPVVSFGAFGAKVILGNAAFCKLAEPEEDCASSFAEAIKRTVELASGCDRKEFLSLADALCWDEKAKWYCSLYTELINAGQGDAA